MGTRGYIIIRAGGRRFAFYKQFDSYPSGNGKLVVVWIIQLIRAFGGDVRAACQCIIDACARLKVTTEEEDFYKDSVRKWPARGAGFDDNILPILRAAAKDGMTFFVESMEQQYCGWDIAYVWTLDFDHAELIMDSRSVAGAAWPMKQLHRLGEERVDCWVGDADERDIPRNDYDDDEEEDEEEDEEGDDEYGQRKYKRVVAACTIQHAWRRYRALMAALEPETGLLFQLAARRFQASANA